MWNFPYDKLSTKSKKWINHDYTATNDQNVVILYFMFAWHECSETYQQKTLFSCHLPSALFLTQKIAHMSFAHCYRQSYHITSTAIWAIDLSYGWKKTTSPIWDGWKPNKIMAPWIPWMFFSTYWFINPINYTVDISPINHSYWSYSPINHGTFFLHRFQLVKNRWHCRKPSATEFTDGLFSVQASAAAKSTASRLQPHQLTGARGNAKPIQHGNIYSGEWGFIWIHVHLIGI